jgi:hypothetical protein
MAEGKRPFLQLTFLIAMQMSFGLVERTGTGEAVACHWRQNWIC